MPSRIYSKDDQIRKRIINIRPNHQQGSDPQLPWYNFQQLLMGKVEIIFFPELNTQANPNVQERVSTLST